MSKRGAILNVELTPTNYGWKIVFTRRHGTGGIDFSQNTAKSLDSALEHIGSTIAVDGYEKQEVKK